MIFKLTDAHSITQNSAMCQLLGLNCATPTDATFSFTGFRQRGATPTTTPTAGALPSLGGWACACFRPPKRRTRPWRTFCKATRSRAKHHRPCAQSHRGRGVPGKTPTLHANCGAPLGICPQRRPQRLRAHPAQPLSPRGQHRQRARFCWLMQSCPSRTPACPAWPSSPHTARAGAAHQPLGHL